MTQRYPTATSYDKCVLNNCEKKQDISRHYNRTAGGKAEEARTHRDSAELDLLSNMQKFCHINALAPNFPGFGGPPFLNSLAMRQMIPK